MDKQFLDSTWYLTEVKFIEMESRRRIARTGRRGMRGYCLIHIEFQWGILKIAGDTTQCTTITNTAFLLRISNVPSTEKC